MYVKEKDHGSSPALVSICSFGSLNVTYMSTTFIFLAWVGEMLAVTKLYPCWLRSNLQLNMWRLEAKPTHTSLHTIQGKLKWSPISTLGKLHLNEYAFCTAIKGTEMPDKEWGFWEKRWVDPECVDINLCFHSLLKSTQVIVTCKCYPGM